MQQGSIVALHIARVKETPSDRVTEATAISAQGLEGDRSCRADNVRQVLIMDQETLDRLELEPGQIKENITTSGIELHSLKRGQQLTLGDEVVLQITGYCAPCPRIDEIRMGLREEMVEQRGMLAKVVTGGTIKTGDPISVLETAKTA